jgi:hypothetical protein
MSTWERWRADPGPGAPVCNGLLAATAKAGVEQSLQPGTRLDQVVDSAIRVAAPSEPGEMVS